MKRKIIAIGIIVMFLGTAIIQVGAEENNKIQMNKTQFQTESEKNLVFMAAIAEINLHVVNITIKGLKILELGNHKIYIGATITAIANASQYGKSLVKFPFPIPGLERAYTWDAGEQIIIKCAFLRIIYENHPEYGLWYLGMGNFVRAYA